MSEKMIMELEIDEIHFWRGKTTYKEVPVKCKYCGKELTTKSVRVIHRRLICNSEKCFEEAILHIGNGGFVLREKPSGNKAEGGDKFSNKQIDESAEQCPYCEKRHKDHEKCYFKQFCYQIQPRDIEPIKSSHQKGMSDFLCGWGGLVPIVMVVAVMILLWLGGR